MRVGQQEQTITRSEQSGTWQRRTNNAKNRSTKGNAETDRQTRQRQREEQEAFFRPMLYVRCRCLCLYLIDVKFSVAISLALTRYVHSGADCLVLCVLVLLAVVVSSCSFFCQFVFCFFPGSRTLKIYQSSLHLRLHEFIFY